MRPAVAAFSLAVGLVLADSAIVTLALPEILRQFDVEVQQVAWVLTAFNLVLALAAVPAARLSLRGDPGTNAVIGLIFFACACAGCAAAPNLEVLIGARVLQAVGGALVICAALELLVAATGSERSGVSRWAAAGVVGAAVGPVAGGLMTQFISWQSIFIVQVPLALAVAVVALGWRGKVPRHTIEGRADRPDIAANAALALISAALTAALFLLVLLLVEGWLRTPALAAVTVTVIPIAAAAARPLAHRIPGADTRIEAVAGALALGGGLSALALLPDANPLWTVPAQTLIGFGLGLTIDAMTAIALRGRAPRALHGGWTIAARHGGVVVGLLILTPIFTADLRAVRAPAERAITMRVLDSPVPVAEKLRLAGELGDVLGEQRQRVPDLAPAFRAAKLTPPAGPRLEDNLQDELERAATSAFRDAFLLAALFALLAAIPAFWMRSER